MTSPSRPVRSPQIDALTASAHDELKRLAHSLLRGDRSRQTLRTTGLVNEAYLRLASQHSVLPEDRPSFLVIAAMTMRRILVDLARRKSAKKRGGGQLAVSLEDTEIAEPQAPLDVRELDRALDELEAIHPIAAKVAEMRLFGGCTFEAIGEVHGFSVGMAHRHWRKARAWISDRLDPTG